tara:strand:- start:154 stop:1005 length:852 start_codon:yes stop_codon:yes gene_type:complete
VPDSYNIHIRPSKGWCDINLKEIWQYRDLLILLIRRDFVAQYKQTVLGPFWLVAQPLLGTGVFTVIFGMVAKLPTDGLPVFLFYQTGMLGWNYFASTYGSNSNALQSNVGLFGKVYFPRIIPPVAVCVTNLFAFLLQLIVFMIVYMAFKIHLGENASFGITPYACFIPLLVFQSALLAIGVGLLMSALTVKYRDLAKVGGLVMQFLMYVSPIIYPLSEVPEKLKWIMMFNPLSFIVESYRVLLLGKGSVSIELALSSVSITLVIAFLGIVLYDKTQRTYVDYV